MKTHQDWTARFLAEPTVLGVADTYGIELLPPIREGRRQSQMGKKGKSNHRWIVGGQRGLVRNPCGLVTNGDWATANGPDSHFQPLVRHWEGRRSVLTDTGFHAPDGDPPNMKICPRGTWNVRLVIETVLSLLTRVCHFKHMAHRVWESLAAHLALSMTAFNLLAQWPGLIPDEQGFVHLSMAHFSL